MSKVTASKNPLVAARESLGLQRNDLAFAANISYGSVWNAERGILNRPPKRMIDTFATFGVDVTNILNDYAAWRIRRGIEVRQSLRATQAAKKAEGNGGQQG